MSASNNRIFSIVSEQEISRLDEMMKNFDLDVSISMSYIRRIQGLQFKHLERRFSGIQGNTLKRYMHQSYPSMRPLHIVAAYSWITMVPMTAFFTNLGKKKFYSGMNSNLVEALACIGRLPTETLDSFLAMICSMINKESRLEFLTFRSKLESEYGKMDDHSHLFPPDILDLDVFAIDYYRSVAIAVKKFREENNLSIATMSRVLGLSKHSYSALENPNKTTHFPVSIGFRVMQGFQLNTHVNFTSEMKYFPEFHKLRQVQHIQHVRERLTVEALRRLGESERESMVKILIILLDTYK
ncbi:helix-turn-helix domain-containing protein [Vibrio mangrovi]|uniref:Helix-turn-helix transcriptional regulator n=1 Tax=Vibrio mangrovi TaxID=474394 RepID=A0A1Y6IY73_9VIBR|nr:helix-turn-helix transcriptional regulator [Vibrio mangrovi]MDW6005214.1 helix-turn-helix transcriptional regulator [Vibrio mangrovi]SMS02576.1 hypothetical protein VIM7927_03909 [Vibrio mangrovi]